MGSQGVTRYRVGVVIVAFNGIQLTRDCLTSLRQSTYPLAEIIVVDNGSVDGSDKILPEEFPEVRFLIQTRNRGFTGGNNVGILWCLNRSLDAILVLNNDTRVEPRCVGQMVQHLGAERLVAPEIRSLRDPSVLIGHVGEFSWTRGVLKDLCYGRPVSDSKSTCSVVDMAGGCCLLIPCSVFAAVGLLDDDFFLYYEDIDFLIRTKAAGFTLVYEPRAIVYHYESNASGGRRVSPLTVYYNTRNRLYVMFKHKSAHIVFYLYFFTTRLIYTAYYILRGEWSLVCAVWRGIRDFYRGRMGQGDYSW